MKKAFNIIKNIFFFFQIYSFPGIIVATITIGGIINYATLFSNLNRVLDRGRIGLDITSDYTYFDNIGALIVAILILVSVYFLIFTLIVVELRFRLKKKLKKGEYKIYQNGNYAFLEFPKRPTTLMFFLLAKLEINNITAKNKGLKHLHKPRAFLRDKEFIFDLSDSNTGKYNIKSLMCYFHDPLGMFNSKLHFDIGKEELTVNKSDNGLKNEIITAENYAEDMNTTFSKQAIENFFGTREYRIGDEIKKIHWKNTAKTGKLIVRLPEDKPIDDNDINIVLNLYAPLSHKLDQSLSIGRFIEKAISQIYLILEKTNNNVNLYINSEDVEVLEQIDKYNKDKLADIIIRKSLTQNHRSFDSFQQGQSLTDMIVFTLSTDLVADQNVKEKYIYNIRDDRSTSGKKLFKKVFTYEKENYYGFNIPEFILRINPVTAIIRMSRNQDLKSISIRNEMAYSQDNSARNLNA